ncbi:rhomboid family intramembrane serine protease [Sphingomonas sp. KR3-1]|uniref:rhomboid family intramembrane serine protease n=1 Tax=Sphingomonas sp. KR3-1 TaxID=3156611 RepID=UPI0032B5DC79
MALEENELSIRSRHGMLRDLLPIYSVYQLFPNVLALGLIVWLGLWLGHIPAIVPLVVMLGWLFQFVTRPSVMAVSKAQASWIEEVLEEQGFYEQSEVDGRWRLIDRQWWQRLPHLFIEFLPGDPITVIAPRDVMEALRGTLELFEEHEFLFPQGDSPFSFQPAEPDPLPWHAQVPTLGLVAACVGAWLWYAATHEAGGMGDWGLSGAALRQGRFENILLHMVAHGGAMHLTMNMSMLAAIGGALTLRLGSPPLSWLRFLLLFLLSGLAGAALYLLVHPAGTVPMVGASGALYGLFALFIRAPADGRGTLSLKSRRIRRVGWELAKQNLFLFGLLAALAWASGGAGGLAWEAHLGGFLFGLLVGPKLLPRNAEARSGIEGPPVLIPGTVAPAD